MHAHRLVDSAYYLLLFSQFKKIWSVKAPEGIIDELYQVFISCRKSCALFIWSESSSPAFKLIFVWKIEMQFYFPKTLHLLICLWRNNFPNLLLPLANCKISRNEIIHWTQSSAIPLAEMKFFGKEHSLHIWFSTLNSSELRSC